MKALYEKTRQDKEQIMHCKKTVNLTQQNKKIKNIQWIVITCEQHELLLQTEL